MAKELMSIRNEGAGHPVKSSLCASSSYAKIRHLTPNPNAKHHATPSTRHPKPNTQNPKPNTCFQKLLLSLTYSRLLSRY